MRSRLARFGTQLEFEKGGWFGTRWTEGWTGLVSIGSGRMEATTVAGMLAFQGRVLRAHFDGDAPPGCSAATVVDQTLVLSWVPERAP